MDLLNNMMDPQDEGPFNGVLYSDFPTTWSGIVSIEIEEETDKIESAQDGVRTIKYYPTGRLSGSINCYDVPKPLAMNTIFVGGMLRDQTYDMVYTVGRYFHILYNMSIRLASTFNNTITAEIEATEYGFEFSTKPIHLVNNSPVSHIIIDLYNISDELKAWIDDTFYEATSTVPRPDEILAAFNAKQSLKITDNGDGTWTATTLEDGIIEMVSPTEFKIGWPSAIYIDGTSYLISTY